MALWFSRSRPQMLSNWTKNDVISAVQGEASLEPSHQAVHVIRTRNINGAYLQRNPFPKEVLNQMFASPLQRIKFLSCISEWRSKHDEILHVRTSNGQSCTLSKLEFPRLSLSLRLEEVKRMASGKLEMSFGVVVLRNSNIRSGSQLLESESLARNQIRWGDSIFIDLDPRRLPQSLSGVTIVTSGKSDIITQEDASRTFPLALMGCNSNHAISAHSMMLHIRDSLRRYQFEIFCPDFGCRRRWDWDRCVRVACLSASEATTLGEQREINRIHVTDRTKACPNSACGAPISRPTTHKTSKVKCLVCDSNYFCWRCMLPWRGESACGNANCITQVLATCPTTEAFGKGQVPIMRGCPQCDAVMEWQQACSHIICPNCSYEYCIVCLKPYQGHQSSSCSVASRQQM